MLRWFFRRDNTQQPQPQTCPVCPPCPAAPGNAATHPHGNFPWGARNYAPAAGPLPDLMMNPRYTPSMFDPVYGAVPIDPYAQLVTAGVNEGSIALATGYPSSQSSVITAVAYPPTRTIPMFMANGQLTTVDANRLAPIHTATNPYSNQGPYYRAGTVFRVEVLPEHGEFGAMPLFAKRNTRTNGWMYYVRDGTRNANQWPFERRSFEELNTGDKIIIPGLPGTYEVRLDETQQQYLL